MASQNCRIAFQKKKTATHNAKSKCVLCDVIVDVYDIFLNKNHHNAHRTLKIQSRKEKKREKNCNKSLFSSAMVKHTEQKIIVNKENGATQKRKTG